MAISARGSIATMRFGLKSMLVIVTLAACALGAWRWYSTRHMRDLANAIQASAIDSESRELLAAIAWREDAWETGLIGNLFEGPALKRVVWHARYLDSAGRGVRVFLLDCFVRPTAGGAFPLVCVTTDDEYRLLAWSSVAEWSFGFLEANLQPGQSGQVLTVLTTLNWARGLGTYQYRVSGEKIESLGEPVFTPLSEGDPKCKPRPFGDDPEPLRRQAWGAVRNKNILKANSP